jgi:hypothetical protein
LTRWIDYTEKGSLFHPVEGTFAEKSAASLLLPFDERLGVVMIGCDFDDSYVIYLVDVSFIRGFAVLPNRQESNISHS